MTAVLHDPAPPAELHDPDGPTTGEPVYDRNGVRRSRDGRPYVKSPCPESAKKGGACVDGRVPGKRAGTTKQCPKCKGAGEKEVLYTRCTSFVGALEDRQNLERWMTRTTVLGIVADYRVATKHPEQARGILGRLVQADADDRETLDALAALAFEVGDGHEKAQKGTDLHGLTERVDRGEPLGEVSIDDRRDMAAWKRLLAEYGFELLDIERFVVHDGLKVGGTYDRRAVTYQDWARCERCEEVGLDGFLPRILDLKTGRVDYGGGKMRQQLALYGNSDAYDPETGDRSQHLVCTHEGYIVHLPAGTGQATLLRTDLVQGWRDVQLSAAVREHRRTSKGALQEVPRT